MYCRNTTWKQKHETLGKFYQSVSMRASGIDTIEGKQRIVVELYKKVFP